MKSYNFTDSQPIGEYTKKQIIALEHEYRLKLKQDGFNDIEMWDNRPNSRRKKLKFIKGRIRWGNYRDKQSLIRNYTETEEYLRIISIYAHHSPEVNIKYRAVLQELALAGSLRKSIEVCNKTGQFTIQAVSKYVRKNITRMIEFVNKMDREDE